ncbi:MAG: ankyrin repeat domain-containing protein [Anaerolineales bacterium]|nr:MAG: ankyrin repeat domain-containing protein [Anaerolineales bacterium]
MSDNFISAIYRNDIAEIKNIIHGGADINEIDKDGRTVLMHAVLAEKADMKIIELLIEAGADVNAYDSDQGWTAIHFAAREQRYELVKVLIENGARVDPTDRYGNTPLWRCVMHASPNITVLQLLLQNGADPEKENRNGISPKNVADRIGNQEVSTLLDSYINL